MLFEDEDEVPVETKAPYTKPPSPVATVRLFHGPAARQQAQAWIETWGEVLTRVGFDASLKVQESRDLLDLVTTPLISRYPQGVLVCLDGAEQRACDPLLKTLEEGVSQGCPRLVLCVGDMTDVVPTIRSRCIALWSPGGETVDSDVVDQVALQLTGNVSDLVKGVPKTPRAWVDGLAVAIVEGRAPLATWGLVRGLVNQKVPYLGLLDALLRREM